MGSLCWNFIRKCTQIYTSRHKGKKLHNWSTTSRNVNHIQKLHKATKFTSKDSKKNRLFHKAPVEPLWYQEHKKMQHTGPKNHPFRLYTKQFQFKEENTQLSKAKYTIRVEKYTIRIKIYPTLLRATIKGHFFDFNRFIDSIVCGSKPCMMSTTSIAISQSELPLFLRLLWH